MLATSLAFGILHFDLVGAAIFGYVMAVLYIKTGTLAIPIACHILNNAFVVGYGIIVGTFESQVTDDRLEDFDGLVWIGVGCLLISLPYLLYFIRKNRPTIILA
jgi:membrane protease YdiL (CAAX protease family)